MDWCAGWWRRRASGWVVVAAAYWALAGDGGAPRQVETGPPPREAPPFPEAPPPGLLELERTESCGWVRGPGRAGPGRAGHPAGVRRVSQDGGMRQRDTARGGGSQREVAAGPAGRLTRANGMDLTLEAACLG
jgi:hypothetical protein